jgi:uncharacterized repeat protein (TIGR02543 family)
MVAAVLTAALVLAGFAIAPAAAQFVNPDSGAGAVYAAAKKATIKFNANGGKVGKKSKKAAYGKKIGKLPAPTRKGYYFKGWYTKKSGGKKITKQSTVTDKKTRTLYAQWSRVPSKYLDKIGVSYYALKKKDASLRQKYAGIVNAAMVCLGSSRSNYQYAFYGGQDEPAPLARIAERYGDRLKCAGIATNVKTLLPGIKRSMTFDEFFAYLGVKKYTYYDEEGAGEGWIVFSYQGMEVNLDTQSQSPTNTIKRTCPIVIWKSSIEESNGKLAGSFW